MRLTLRTLLAYLDDRLPPANTRELGQKIAASPFAKELADRIKEVVRRRRLATDAPNQKHIDPNLVAEYLDDQLTPELVALIEKEVLASDHSLAEVAAGHQILGLLTDPVQISDALKSRLYKLDPANEPDSEPQTETPDSDLEPAAWQPLAPQQVAQKRSPMPLLLVMILGWLVLLFTDANLFRSSQPSTDATGVAIAQVDTEQPGDAKPADANAAQAVKTAEQQPAAVEPGKTAEDQTVSPRASAALAGQSSPSPQLPNGGEPKTGAKATQSPALPASKVPADGAPSNSAPSTQGSQTQPASSGAPAEVAEVPGDQTVAAAADATDVGAVPAASSLLATDASTKPMASATTDAAAKPAVTYLELRDTNRTLLLFQPTSGDWNWASTPETRPTEDWSVRLNENLAAISEPFEARIIGRNSGWLAIVKGPAIFRSVMGSGSGLELLEGRVILQRDPTAVAKPDADATFTLKVQNRTFQIALPEPDRRIGITVMPLPLPPTAVAGTEDSELEEEMSAESALLPLNHPSLLSITAADTAVRVLTAGMEQPAIVPEGQVWWWDTMANAPVSAPFTEIAPTEWVFIATEPKPDSTRELIAEAAKQLRETSSVSNAAAALVQDRNPQVAAWAVRLSATTRNVEQLSNWLLQSKEEVVRREAIVGLRQMLLQSEAGSARVIGALENRLSEMELADALRLLAGVSRTAAEDREVSAWLLQMLSSNREAMREMAIYNLEEVTGERNGYFAGDDGGRRSPAVRRWERYVERNDGRLIQPPK